MCIRRIAVVCALGLAGCGSGILGSTPSSVVKDSYIACNAGEYSKAKSYFTKDVQNLLDGTIGTAAGGIKRACDEGSHNGNISKVDITSEKIRGEGATVIADIHFKDGTTNKGDVTQLIKENGVWKISQ